jgi:hypothetical protein
MLEFKKPIPVVVKETKQEGYAIYVTNSGQFENDIWTIALCEGGRILHVRTDQIVIHNNFTFGIKGNQL